MAVVVVVVSWDSALEKVPRRKELGHQFHRPACEAVECLHLQAAQAPKVQVQELGGSTASPGGSPPAACSSSPGGI